MCFTSYTILTIIFVYIIGLDYVATWHFLKKKNLNLNF